MDEIIRCRIMGVASVDLGGAGPDADGRQIWIGVRVRPQAGPVRFLERMVLEAEASLILQDAMETGDPVELWLTGKEGRVHPYGIRTATEAWYSDALGRDLRKAALKYLAIGVLLLPALGIGVLGLIASAGYLSASSTFAPRRSREEFMSGDASDLATPARTAALVAA